jgi:hypothetical protein
MISRSQLRRLGACVMLAAAPAFAQTPSLAPAATPGLDSAPGKITPGAKATEPTQNLSDRLNQSNGVIHPKDVDPAMEKPTPKTGDPNVLPPPSSSPKPK